MKPSNKLTLNHLLETLHLVYRSSPKWTFINAIITSIRGFIPLLLLFVVKQLIDVVGTYVTNNTASPEALYTTLALTAAFFLLNAVSGSISSLVRERQSHFVNDYIQDIIHKKTIHIAYRFFEDSDYQNIFYRALNDSSYRPARIFYSLLQLAQNTLTIILLLIVLSQIHWALIPILAVSSAPVFYLRILYTRRLYKYRKNHTEDERRVHYFNRLLTGKDFAKELRVFNLGKTFKKEYEHFKHDLRNKQWSLSKRKTINEIAVQLFSTAILLFIIAFVIKQTVEGNISAGTMAMYFLALQRAYSVLQGLLGNLSSLYEDNLFLKNFFEFKNIEVKREVGTESFPNPIINHIKFENVSFKYPNSRKWALQNINLTIQKGKTIALVGENGSGKTTLVKLLCGLHEPTEGQLHVDQHNWNNISNSELANNISVIFQDFMLYNISAKENIRLGNTHRKDEPESVAAAAVSAGIDQLFNNLPHGYDTTLGTLFKDSQMLSRGEWQRTALARSFYNTDAQLIILDEPTSSLDAFTEASLINHFSDIVKDKTAIIVSHRLSTIKLADIIVVMKNASIAEVGSPEELIAQKGIYFQMIESLK
ncbi:ABC transporter ATP-binding protein [Carboxylicivirga marina]|uniref:ABC transporter ATP-binding protein n=1 Tax=Carboxylicivirga marina TaxID=2800988 RepID=UPI00259329D2|nr:ABC transporter ATP-binding protein [uncultured Carboxylicivirga sp.]